MSTVKRRRIDHDAASTGGGPPRAGNGRRGGGQAAAALAAQQAQLEYAAQVGAGGSRSKGGAAAAAAMAGSSSAANLKAAAADSSGPHVPVLSLSTLPIEALARYALHYGLIQPEPLTSAQATHPTPQLAFELGLSDGNTHTPRRKVSLIPERAHRASAAATGSMPSANVNATSADPGVTGEEDFPALPTVPNIDFLKSSPTAGDDDTAMVSGADNAVASTSTSANGPQKPSGSNTNSEANSNSNATQSRRRKSSKKRARESSRWEDPGEPDAEELRGMTAYGGGLDQVRERLGALAKAHWEKSASVKEGETIINFAYAIRMRNKVLKSVPPC